MKSFVEGGVVVGESIYKGRNRGASSTKYGSFGGACALGWQRVRRSDPSPKSIQLHRVETLGQKTFSALPILTFTATLFATATGRTSLSFPQLHIHPHTPQAPCLVEK